MSEPSSGSQSGPVVAVDADGDFVVVWRRVIPETSSSEVVAQRFNSAGRKEGIAFRVNPGTAAYQPRGVVAMEADGDFAVAWLAEYDGNPWQVRARRFRSDGAPRGDAFDVSASSSGAFFPAIATDADGDLFVSWTEPADYPLQKVLARRFDRHGLPKGDEFPVAPDVDGHQRRPAVACSAVGACVVAWENGVGSDIRAQRFSRRGAPVGSAIEVHVPTETRQEAVADIAMNAAGDFVIVWGLSGFENEIWGRAFNRNGAALTDQTRINVKGEGSPFRWYPSVAMDWQGDAFVTWYESDESSTPSIRGRRLSPMGLPRGPERMVSSGSYGAPSGGMDADGDLLVAFAAPSGGTSNVFAQRYRGDEPIDLAVSQADVPDPVGVGAPYSVTVTVNNLHPAVAPTGIPAIDGAIGAAQGARVELELADPAAEVGGVDWLCPPRDVPRRCIYQKALAAGASAPPISISLTAPATSGEASNTATLRARQVDPNPLNDVDVVTTTITEP